MAFEQTLLERIDNSEQGDYRLTAEPHLIIESILRHLRKMLNVRQGSVSTLPDYGIPDLNSLFMQYPDAVLALRKIIRDSLEKYEPRLRGVKVRHYRDEDNPLTLRFQISARLVLDDDKTSPIQFETFVGDNGLVKVRG